jgi:hypothetical protein
MAHHPAAAPVEVSVAVVRERLHDETRLRSWSDEATKSTVDKLFPW